VLVEGASDRAAPTACGWRVRRGSMLADDGLQDAQTAVPGAATGVRLAAASCALDGDRPGGSSLGIGACYEPRHVGGGLATARHATPTAGSERRLHRWSISWYAHRAYFQFARFHDPVHLTPALVVHATACDAPFLPTTSLDFLRHQPCAACLVSCLPCSLYPPRRPLCSPGPVVCHILTGSSCSLVSACYSGVQPGGVELLDMIPDVHTWQVSTLAIFLDCAPRHMYFLLGGHPQTTLAPCKPRLFPSRQDWAEPVSLEGRLASNVLRKSMLLVFSHPLARERPLPCASSRCRHYCSCIFCGVLASVLSAPLAEFSTPLIDITPPVLADSCRISDFHDLFKE